MTDHPVDLFCDSITNSNQAAAHEEINQPKNPKLTNTSIMSRDEVETNYYRTLMRSHQPSQLAFVPI